VNVDRTTIPGVLIFTPQPHHDERGLFTRTFDADVARSEGIDPAAFSQDSQSRSIRGVVRGMHGRSGAGEAKLVRCARGAVCDVLVDIRASSPTFGESITVALDDVAFRILYVPPGLLHGFQVVSDLADVCYRINRTHNPEEDMAVHYADPDLAIAWPNPVTVVSDRDRAAGTWQHLISGLHG